MNILLLAERDDCWQQRLVSTIRKYGDTFTWMRGSITPNDVPGFDWAVSYSYRHLLKPDVLAVIPAINLHISYLPWNRGADPNLWSWIEDTPKGVTIHKIDAGIDTGPIYAQRRVDFRPAETLATSYAKLQDEILALFADTWPHTRSGELSPFPQGKRTPLHLVKDRAAISLPLGWETPVAQLVGRLTCQ